MSQFTGLLSATGLGSIRNLGVVAAEDVTPDAVNFTSIYFNNEFGEYAYTEKQITGINQTITLRVEYSSPGSQLYYSVSNTSGLVVFGDNVTYDSPTFYFGMEPIGNLGTFSVQNNQYVTFGVQPNCGVNDIVTVINLGSLEVAANIVLDTFNINYYGEC